jgi:ribosomal protein S18 acetylase RimI-like enzyme
MTVTIRRARGDDLDFLTEVVVLASRSHLPRGVWDIMFQDDEALSRRIVRTILATEQPSWCRRENFLVAEVDGQPAAALSGYWDGWPGMVAPEAAITQAATACGLGEREIGQAFERLVPFLTCIPEDLGHPWIVEWVATLAPFRRQGLVDRLLAEVLGEGRRQGQPLAQIMILIGNLPARRAYERAGFVRRDERRTDEFAASVGCPGLMRFTMPL